MKTLWILAACLQLIASASPTNAKQPVPPPRRNRAKSVTRSQSSASSSTNLDNAWMAAVLAQLSPKVSEMGTNLLNTRVEPLVEGALKALHLGSKAFKFTRINLGQVKPQITNIRTHPAIANLNRITVDFDLVYLGDGDIQVSILGVSSGIRNAKIAGRARVVLSPTMSELPLVGGVQFFFLTKPEIDFAFDGAAKIADLPVIKRKIKEDLLADLNEQAVFPNRLTIPLSWTADPQLIWQPQVTGILGVKVKSVDKLPRRGGARKLFGQDKPDVYAVVGVGGKEWSTKVKKNSIKATWDDWYEFPLEEFDGHVVELNLFDDDTSSADEFLGYAAVDVKNFMQQPNFLTPQQTVKRGPTNDAIPSNQPMEAKKVAVSLQSVPGRKSKYTNIGGDVELEMAWQPLAPIPGLETSRLFPGSTKAVLTVFLYSATNLAKFADGGAFPAGHIPSTQAEIKVANYTKSSDVIRDNQNANFNLGEIFSLQQNWKTQTIDINIKDTEKNKSLGSVKIPLNSLVGTDKVKDILPLNSKFPSQTIVVSAKIRFPFNPMPMPTMQQG